MGRLLVSSHFFMERLVLLLFERTGSVVFGLQTGTRSGKSSKLLSDRIMMRTASLLRRSSSSVTFNLNVLAQMTTEQKDAIANVLITQVFKQHNIIVNEGDMASSYYIIKQGQVEILKNQKFVRIMKSEDSFGEQALFEDSKRGATVRALEDNVMCLALGRD